MKSIDLDHLARITYEAILTSYEANLATFNEQANKFTGKAENGPKNEKTEDRKHD